MGASPLNFLGGSGCHPIRASFEPVNPDPSPVAFQDFFFDFLGIAHAEMDMGRD